MSATEQPAAATPTAGTERAPVLVLGLGNLLMRDDGIGVRVVQAMQQRPLPAGVEVWDGGTAGFALLDVLANRQKLIVIDAIDTGAAPGSIQRLSASELGVRTGARISLHEIGFAETLAAAKRMGLAPAKTVILGLQPGDLASGLELSPQVKSRMPELLAMVESELKC